MPGSGNGLGNTLAHAGVGGEYHLVCTSCIEPCDTDSLHATGLGFGAGSAVASNIVNAIL